jgi:ribonucleoside-diphosphate reductase alpha chain
MDLNLSSTTQTLAPQAISLEVLIEKYAKGGERNVAEVQRRVAQGLAQAEAPEQRALWAERFEQALSEGFVPAGRIQSAVGTPACRPR